MMDVIFETFATLITAALPPDIAAEPSLGRTEDVRRSARFWAEDQRVSVVEVFFFFYVCFWLFFLVVLVCLLLVSRKVLFLLFFVIKVF